jgi:hypothetical protein
MPRLFKSKKILIPDISPPANRIRDDIAMIIIGILCGVAVIAAMAFVFFGA